MSLETANKDLSRVAAKLQALAKHILESAKHQERTPSDRLAKLEEAARLASDINLEECRTMLQAQLDEARQQRTAEIHSRREALLNAARFSGVPTDPGTNGDRIDVFRLSYEGAVVAISFGGVALPKLKETDGAKVLEHLKKLRDTLQQAPFNRESFLKLLKAAYAILRRTAGNADEYVGIRELHREIILEQARRSPKFAKDPDPKHLVAYPLFQFLFDLARFGQGGWKLGQDVIKTQAPSMREQKDAVYLPDLERPLTNETAIAGLAIKSVQSGEFAHGAGSP